MQTRSPAQRFAVAFGALAAALPIVSHIALWTSARGWEPSAGTRAGQVVDLVAWLPLLAVGVVAVWLASRPDRRSRAGLVMLAMGGLMAVPGLQVLTWVGDLGAEQSLTLWVMGTVAAIAAGIAALVALRSPDRPSAGSTDRAGTSLGADPWRALAALAAGALAVPPLLGMLTWLQVGWPVGDLRDLGMVAGGLAQGAVYAVVAVLVLRADDLRMAALLALVPAAVAFVDAVGALKELLRPSIEGAPAPPLLGVGLQAVAGAALAVAAVALWLRHRPLGAPEDMDDGDPLPVT